MDDTLHISRPGVASEVASEAELKPTERLTLPESPERILVVDDDEMVLNYVASVLQRQGYRVLTQTCPRAALDAFCLAPGEVDLVITDQDMPIMTGAELARHVLHLNPGLAIILLTGNREGMTQEQAKAIGFRKLAIKPLLSGELITLVRDVLDEPEHAPRE